MTLRKKCPYLEFFWSVFSRIWAEYGDTPYLFVFSSNVGKYGLEKLRIRTPFMQCDFPKVMLLFPKPTLTSSLVSFFPGLHSHLVQSRQKLRKKTVDTILS